MNIQSLHNTSIIQLKNCFNASFANYAVPLKLTGEQLQQKFKNDNVDLRFSSGVFENEELKGFVFKAIDIQNGGKMCYNSGTGVLPEFRGQGLTSKMYEFLLPKLKKEAVKSCILEVIDSNIPAIKTYEKIGFKKVRELISFKGIPQIKLPGPEGIKVQESVFDLKGLEKLKDFEASWQNSGAAIERSKENLSFLSLKKNDEILGFAVFNPINGRISQFGIHQDHRRKGLGKFLFKKISQHLQGPVTIINVDSEHTASIDFLQNIQLDPFLTQYEMKMDL
ncbi:hypothetical protein C7S20_13130 [Christiangramia fulva]|uniref:N-acetyltransferase domain-containing protein n=1 Tax=Christiangramia fulva TaxID=2126553 RepID=A0A2R3Z761_9FLAO|nr:GNAT family N-acetyltransferase [Christiangramia fulva]AVR46123.1 hypothetical protein C7S20_13130 [Christiangramia fulva]